MEQARGAVAPVMGLMIRTSRGTEATLKAAGALVAVPARLVIRRLCKIT